MSTKRTMRSNNGVAITHMFFEYMVHTPCDIIVSELQIEIMLPDICTSSTAYNWLINLLQLFEF